jgi:hypothetical protein
METKLNRTIFTAWMGDNPMTVNRLKALLSIVHKTASPHVHVTLETLDEWVDPARPLHPLFPLLSAVHKTDYFRCYAMHVHGGGYTDIKHTHKRWNRFFDALEQSDAYALGYTEVGPHGIAPVGGELEEEMKANFHKVIGVCSMIARPQTKFTTEWFQAVTRKMDEKAELLERNPAKHPMDSYRAIYSDGTHSTYPFGWTELLGKIFHPLSYANSERILHSDIAPSFSDYR